MTKGIININALLHWSFGCFSRRFLLCTKLIVMYTVNFSNDAAIWLEKLDSQLLCWLDNYFERKRVCRVCKILPQLQGIFVNIIVSWGVNRYMQLFQKNCWRMSLSLLYHRQLWRIQCLKRIYSFINIIFAHTFTFWLAKKLVTKSYKSIGALIFIM